MISVSIGKSFDTKIINAETKQFSLCCIPSEACRVFTRDITTRRKVFTKLLYANTADYFKPYIIFNFDVNVPIVGYFLM